MRRAGTLAGSRASDERMAESFFDFRQGRVDSLIFRALVPGGRHLFFHIGFRRFRN